MDKKYYLGDTVIITSDKTKQGDHAELILYGDQTHSIQSTDYSDGQYRFTVNFNSNQYTSGNYTYAIRVVTGQITETIEVGSVELIQLSKGTVTKSPDERLLDIITGYLLDPNNIQYASESIAGVSITRYSLTELMSIKSDLEKKIAKQKGSKMIIHRFDL